MRECKATVAVSQADIPMKPFRNVMRLYLGLQSALADPTARDC